MNFREKMYFFTLFESSIENNAYICGVSLTKQVG